MLTDGAALNRWRLVLGKNAGQQISLTGSHMLRMDDVLDFLYSRESGEDVRDAQGGLGDSQPTVAHWLSEVRTLFPQETAEILQRHALDRYQLTELLSDREVLEQVYFNGRIKRYNPWRVVLAVDESGSMLSSVIHSAVMAGIFARLPMLVTRLVIFDTNVVDLNSYVDDPAETLMSIQLGGGTDIAKAMSYCETLITFPHRTMVVLVSNLCKGGSRKSLYGVCHDIIESGASQADKLKELTVSLGFSPNNQALASEHLTAGTCDDSLLKKAEPQDFSVLGWQELHNPVNWLADIRTNQGITLASRYVKLYRATGPLGRSRYVRQKLWKRSDFISILGTTATAAMEAEHLAQITGPLYEGTAWLHQLARTEPETLEVAQGLCGAQSTNMRVSLAGVLLCNGGQEKPRFLKKLLGQNSMVDRQAEFLFRSNVDSLVNAAPALSQGDRDLLADCIRKGDPKAPVPFLASVHCAIDAHSALTAKFSDPYLAGLPGTASFVVTLGQYLTILYTLRLVMLIGVAEAALTIGLFCPNARTSYLISTIVMGFPALLPALGVEIFKWVSPLVPVASAELMWGLGSGSFLYLLPWVTWLLIALSPLFVCHKKRVR